MSATSAQSGPTALGTRPRDKRSGRALLASENPDLPLTTLERIPMHPNATRVCCGKVVGPRLAEVGDDSGQVTLVASPADAC